MSENQRTSLARDADSGHDLVICYGNPLRGDDGLGWHVAQLLIEAQLEQLKVVVVHQLTPELSEPIAQARRVVFVDASLEIQAGTVLKRNLKAVAPAKMFTHHLEPGQLLELARRLFGGVPEKAVVVSVGVVGMEFTERLSPRIQAAIPSVLEMIHHEIHSNNKPVTAW